MCNICKAHSDLFMRQYFALLKNNLTCIPRRFENQALQSTFLQHDDYEMNRLFPCLSYVSRKRTNSGCGE